MSSRLKSPLTTSSKEVLTYLNSLSHHPIPVSLSLFEITLLIYYLLVYFLSFPPPSLSECSPYKSKDCLSCFPAWHMVLLNKCFVKGINKNTWTYIGFPGLLWQRTTNGLNNRNLLSHVLEAKRQYQGHGPSEGSKNELFLASFSF